MSKNEKMCDCNQGRLPCTCKPQPSEQHQGEPVAWRVSVSGEWFYAKNKAECERERADYESTFTLEELNEEGREVPEPLFAHADPGEACKWRNEAHRFNLEVERLRFELREAKALTNGQTVLRKEDAEDWANERDTLRAQLADLREALELEQEATAKWQETAIQTSNKLAERDALLDRVVDHANFWHDHPYAEVVEAIAKDYKALSASAEPSKSISLGFGNHISGNKLTGEVTLNFTQCQHNVVEGNTVSAEPSAPVERDERALQEERRLGIERLPVEPSAPVEIDERTEFESLRKNAERYLWLRDVAGASYGTLVGDKEETAAEKDASVDEGMARVALERKP